MIPVCIRLKGFLSYKEEQTINFEEASLWVLTGPNGSGKSTIFDAITYALFNAHRGGQQNAEELIHKQAQALEVDFQFRIRDKHYRVCRTLKKLRSKGGKIRASGTRQAYERHSDQWKPIPDTDKEEGFKAWIKNLLGFDYKTFTSSVLLLQGQAEKLLQYLPKERFEVLKHVVDLERYDRLYQCAEEKYRNVKVQREAIRQHYESIRVVTAEQLQQAEQVRQQAEHELQACQERLDELHHWRGESIRWMTLQQQLQEYQQRLSQTQALCQQAATLERDYHRWCELRQTLPVVETIITTRQKIQESQACISRIQQDLATRQAELARLQEEQRRRQEECNDHRQRLEQDQAQRAAIQHHLLELTPLVTLLDQRNQVEETVQRWEKELQSYPPDLEEQCRQLDAEVDQLNRWKEDYSNLEDLHRHQSRLRQATTQLREVQVQEQKLLSEGQQARQNLQSLEQQRDQLQQAHEAAQQHLIQAQTLEQQASRHLEEFHTLQGATTCSLCGQPLTAEHYAAEERRRQNTLAASQTDLYIAQTKARKTQQEYEEAKRACEQARQHLEQLREQYSQAKQRSQQLQEQIQTLQADCTDAWWRLSPERQASFGSQPPADWTVITYPSREDLTRLNEEIKRLPTLKSRADDLRKQRDRFLELQALLKQALQQREDLDRKLLSHGDLASLRQQQQQLQTREAVLQREIDTRQKTIRTLESDIQRWENTIRERENTRTRLLGDVKTEEEKQKHFQQQIEREEHRLPSVWQQAVSNAGLSQWHAWKQEQEELEQRSIETLYQQLQQARQQQQELQHQVQALQEQVQAFPLQARRNPVEWDKQIQDVKKQENLWNQRLTDARVEYQTLLRDQKERATLQVRLREAELQQSRWKKLSQLLGREGLQLDLLRKAEQQIVTYANCVLDRLSEGTLYLQRTQTEDGSSTDRALDLECINRRSGGEAIPIAYLSGSQKFRVAVALALGIGQYVSHRHQPIECVIIDEGFGCLDREGRQVMVQELRKLGQCLKCILLVSHQEEFADAFPNGYRFRLVDGTTRVESI